MTVFNLKSVPVTNLDAVPSVANTIGEGGPGDLRIQTDTVSPQSGDSVGSTYRLCRFSTAAKVKTVFLSSTVAGAGAADIDVAFSDNPIDGSPPSFAGGVVVLPTNRRGHGN